jgi:hypothetical protein
MDNYHKFKCDHVIQFEKWWMYWLPNYLSINRLSQFQVQLQQLLVLVQLVEGEGANGSRNVNSTTTKSDVLAFPLVNGATMWTFNLVVEFFWKV